jgi:hypothetical protein
VSLLNASRNATHVSASQNGCTSRKLDCGKRQGLAGSPGRACACLVHSTTGARPLHHLISNTHPPPPPTLPSHGCRLGQRTHSIYWDWTESFIACGKSKEGIRKQARRGGTAEASHTLHPLPHSQSRTAIYITSYTTHAATAPECRRRKGSGRPSDAASHTPPPHLHL